MPGAGCDDLHVCIDDHSRIGFAQISPDETGASVTAFPQAAVAYLRQLGVRTNGKAERFIQTALREWAYARAYRTSRQRAAHLTSWLHRVERRRDRRFVDP